MSGGRNRRRVTGAILAGGRSSRMGKAKNAITLNDGRTMLEHVREALSPLCSPIVIVGRPPEAQEWPSQGFDIPIIEDLRAERGGVGPLGGIEALLAHGAADDEYLICPCDVPRITSEVLESLLAPAAALSTVLRVAGFDEPNPLPARISGRALPVVREMLDEGRRAVHLLHQRLGAHVIAAPAAWEPLLANVNTPQDLDELNRR